MVSYLASNQSKPHLDSTCQLCYNRAMDDAQSVKPDQRTTNAVRQVLMNELGLTRESVREEVTKIVEGAVEKFFNDSRFEKFLQQRVDAALRTYHYGSSELQTLITTLVGKAVQEQVMADIKERILTHVQVEVKAQFGNQPQS